MGDRTTRIDVTRDEDLHLRPMQAIAEAALRFTSEVTVIRGGQTADAKSILDLMMLATARGPLEVRASGDDADAACAALEDVLGTELNRGRSTQ
jgi:phosphotransferase system HPr (HPr) family protein